MRSKDTVWVLEEHSAAKHEILRTYLQAWFPILSRYHGRVIYFDGFAGPGRYRGGETGSPLIALDVARHHRSMLAGDLVFVFVEADRLRARHLQREIASLQLPAHFNCHIENRDFEQVLSEALDNLDKSETDIAPTFALIDPFGITGLPMNLIGRLLQRKRCEVLITFMNHAIERWAAELPNQIDNLFGMTGAAAEIASSSDRVIRARHLYSQVLNRSASYVRFFEMRTTRNRPIYDLFFATNHELGHYKMKEAMWKIDANGGYRFSDGVSKDQLILFGPEPEREFASVLWRNFRGNTVLTDEVLRYTRNNTPYLESHARAALKLLENRQIHGCNIEVAEEKQDGKRRRKGTFPSGARISFRR